MAFLKRLKSQTELDGLLDRHTGLVVVEFWGSRCSQCHTIAPFFEKLSNIHRHVAFAKVEVDSSEDMARKYNVTGVPTFILFKDKQIIYQVRGADSRALENAVVKHAPLPSAADSSASGSTDEPAAGDISLLEFLDLSQVNCLNESTQHSLKPTLASKARNTSNTYLLSDADEQLLLNLTFHQQVRVRSIVLQCSNPAQGPKKIKLMTNKPSLGFEDVEDAEEPAVAQVLEVPEENIKEGKHIRLRYVRFQTVNSLHIFVASNQGGEDETRIDAIDVFGVPVESTRSLTGLKKSDE